jgi:hypothetical protein
MTRKKQKLLGNFTTTNITLFRMQTVAGVDVTAGPLACGQYIYGRASQTEQRSARWASWYSRATWASNFCFFRVIQVRRSRDDLLLLFGLFGFIS